MLHGQRLGGQAGAFFAVSYADLPGWQEDAMSRAFAAFVRSARHAAARRYRTGSLGVHAGAFKAAYRNALQTAGPLSDGMARSFFERHFIPCRVGPEPDHPGFVTGYYEPEAAASPSCTEVFHVPIYRPPEDLIRVDSDNRPAGLDHDLAYARREGKRLVPYHDRAAIDSGVLVGRGLELCWLKDRVDAFFIHIQGAARLAMVNGGTKRITYAAKSGHPFTGIGRVLADLGEIPLARVTMQSIREWLARNPHRIDEILWKNRSYIFFRETLPGEQDLGPIAAAKVQLEPGRSLAVDRLRHTFGTPFFIDAPELRIEGQPFRRLMIAQDTGSAIIGSARGDLFIGSGREAGQIAGKIRHSATFYALLPRPLLEVP